MNPAYETPPDFADADYEVLRDALINGAVAADHIAAAAYLNGTWIAGSVRKQAAWEAQELEDSQLVQEELEQERQMLEDAVEAQRAEARARRPKVIPIDRTRKIGDVILMRPCTYALNLLEKVLICPLWYFTQTGLNEAAHNAQNPGLDEVFGLTRTEGGVTIKTVNSSAASPNAILDRYLSWRDYSIAQISLLQNMKACGWDESYVEMMHEFFQTINLSPMRNQVDGRGDEILLLYQARTRQHWHDGLKQGINLDLSELNLKLLASMEKEVLDSPRPVRTAVLLSFQDHN